MVTRKPKGALTRCSSTMTEPQFLAWVRSALRSRWLKWIPRSQAILSARRPYRGTNKMQKWEVACAICQKWFKISEVEVDHLIDAGSILSVDDIGQFVNRLYCEPEHLRVVCKPCHKCHTLSQSKGITFSRAAFEKRVNERMKSKDILAYLAKHGYNGALVSNATKRKLLVEQILLNELPKGEMK